MISVAWLWFVGLLGGLIASGGLNANGAEAPQRLLGSALVGAALAGPVLLTLTHRFTWPHVRRLLVAAIAAAVAGAGTTYGYWS